MAYHPSPKKISILVFVVILILVVVFFHRNITNLFNKSGADSSAYQAVFLTNGQVYFGKISQTENDYVVLTNIYYLQANNPLQTTSSPDSKNAATTPPAQSQMSLVKLGNELHGPTDEMYINRDQILFFENLKPDSRVVSAITAYQKGNTASPSDTSSLQF
jgi:hypothetical protein